MLVAGPEHQRGLTGEARDFAVSGLYGNFCFGGRWAFENLGRMVFGYRREKCVLGLSNFLKLPISQSHSNICIPLRIGTRRRRRRSSGASETCQGR